MDKYNQLCEIGKGACGAVFLVRSNETKRLLALKKIELDESRKTRTKEAVLREARILSELKHPHIVAYHDSFFDGDEKHLLILQDYCDGGTLDDKIKEASQKKEFFEEKQVIQWFLQLALAVRYMHSKRVLHRDLKTQNVFLNKSGSLCKLGDFGIAKSMDTTIDVASTCVGTPCYLSPEMCQDIPYTSKADVWALGCMLYEMVVLRPAFDAFNLVSLFYKIVQGEYNPIPDSFSDEMAELVKLVLSKSPDERPSANGILAISYVKRHLLQFIEEKEFILQERRAPTRQGSRPYSTPTNSRPSFLDGVDMDNDPESIQKRALSCRPSMTVKKDKEKLLSAKVSNRSGRVSRSGVKSANKKVSTIPEEPEEQSLRLEKQQQQIQAAEKAQKETVSKSDDDNRVPPLDVDDNSNNIKADSRGDEMTADSAAEDGFREPPLSSRSDKTDYSSKSDISGKSEKSSRTARSSHSARSASSRTTHARLERGGSAKKHKEVKFEKDYNPKDLRLDIKEAKQLSNISRDSPAVGEKLDSPRMARINIGASSHTPDLNATPKRKPILQPQRTPRIVENNTLIIQQDKPATGPNLIVTNHRPPRAAKAEPVLPVIVDNDDPAESVATFIEDDASTNTMSTSPVKPSAGYLNVHRNSKSSGKSRKGSSGKKTRISAGRKSSSRSKSSATHSGRPTTRGSSAVSIPEEPDDYYSDDFDEDDNTSGSLTDDDIPEELDRKSYISRAMSNTHTFEIPEIEEDLEGIADDDDGSLGGNDFDDCEIEEELDHVLISAKTARAELESAKVRDEDVVYDQPRANTSQFIRDHCMDALGKEKYEKVRSYCEKNRSPEMRKLEKMVGKEHAKTAYLMTTTINPPNNHKSKK